MATLPGLPADVYFGDPEKKPPDWRDVDPGPDDDDPEPIGREFLTAVFGFDPYEEEPGEGEKES